MNNNKIDIDNIVNYKAEYSAIIKKNKITGNQLIGLCPFHNDKNNSFSVNLQTGKWHCFSEDISGNYISFVAKLNNISEKEAYKQILERYGVADQEPDKEKKKEKSSYTLAEYAADKHLSEEFLRGVCHVETGRDRDKTEYLKVPYYDINGQGNIFRKRYADKQFRWSYGSSGKLLLYGEWRIPEFKQNKYVILVEGESDTQALWSLRLPALGAPGASNFKPETVPKLAGMHIYIHKENDNGGETFFQRIRSTLRDADFKDPVYVFSCSDLGVKDPSDLYIAHGEAAGSEIYSLLQKAKPVDLQEGMPKPIEDAPVNLKAPKGWIYSDEGIGKVSIDTGMPNIICRTPILLTHRLKSTETGEEKMEISFKRDGYWQSAAFPRSTLFTSKGITTLSDLGCTITSENAKQMVRFLQALEAENLDTIPRSDAASVMGWQTHGRFLPGFGKDIILDIDPSLRSWANAYHQSGNYDTWRQLMAPHRQRNRFRFILAAAFTAPLLRIIRQRIFILYNWGGSKGGKTAALKAALSVWGEPEKLMINFNATTVALERMAGFYNDLPMGIDERQLAGNKQGTLEQIIYMIASGTGRARGSKTGGLQVNRTWRTVAMATGEEPITQDTTQTGVSTRVLEIYGGPFDDEKSASLMHQQTAQHYGFAGIEFMQHILRTDEQSIKVLYDQMVEQIYSFAGEVSGAHVASIAAVTFADAIIDTWLFRDKEDVTHSMQGGQMTLQEAGKQPLRIDPESWQRAIQMARFIVQEQINSGVQDVNENATQFIVDWILSNEDSFTNKAMGQRYGVIEDIKSKAYIFPSILNQALSKAGYSPRKTMKYLADQGLITVEAESNGKQRYTIKKWHVNKVYRFVEFHIGKFTAPPGTQKTEIETTTEHAAGKAAGQPNIPKDFQSAQNEQVPFEDQNLQQESLPDYSKLPF